ncbi:MAG: AAA family ATPase, partial [Proteobacteria bacterium]|nr:AAA family ATPase [Pseudomonadota bacterium]
MYLEHFGLNEAPFRITPHTDFFYDGAERGATLDALLYAIQHDEGIVKVSGEVGSGKTMLCRVLMERLPAQVVTIYLANPSLSRDEILFAIADELEIDSRESRLTAVMRALQDHLIELYAAGRRVVILIDEAHAMPEDTLEQVRLLSNLETSRHKLLQIVLFGQPELEDMLAAASMRQLRDRVTHSFRMRPLDEADVGPYLTFRLRAAGYRGPDLFTPRAITLIARASGGLTRRINILADKALLSAFSADSHTIDDRPARAAIADAELSPLTKPRRRIGVGVGVAALAAGALLGAAVQWVLTSGRPDPAPKAPVVAVGSVATSKPSSDAAPAKP